MFANDFHFECYKKRQNIKERKYKIIKGPARRSILIASGGVINADKTTITKMISLQSFLNVVILNILSLSNI